MTDEPIDRLARVLSGSTSRRQTLAALGALAAARLRPVQAATQIEIPACGEAGAVCTMIKGCCTGLVCATSMINPSYGVCVAGEGEILPVSDSIIVPTSEGITEELAQAVSEAAADATAAQSALTTEESERQAQIDAKRAKKDTRRSTKRTNKDTRRTTQDATRDARRDTRRLNAVPQLSLELIEEVPPELGDDPDDEGQPEILRVRNHDDVSVELSRIESIQQPDVFSTRSVTIAAGGTHLLLSGQYATDAQKRLSGSSVWTEESVCPEVDGDDGDGVHMIAALSGATETHRLSVRCGQTTSTVAPPQADNNRRQQQNNDQQQRRRDRRRDAKKKHQDRRRAKRGNG